MSKLSDIGVSIVEGGAFDDSAGAVILENGSGERAAVSLKRGFGVQEFSIKDNEDGTVHEFLGDVAYHEGMTTGEVFGLVEQEVSDILNRQMDLADLHKLKLLSPSVDLEEFSFDEGVSKIRVGVSIEDEDGVYLMGRYDVHIKDDNVVNITEDSLLQLDDDCLMLAEQIMFSPDMSVDISYLVLEGVDDAIKEFGVDKIKSAENYVTRDCPTP